MLIELFLLFPEVRAAVESAIAPARAHRLPPLQLQILSLQLQVGKLRFNFPLAQTSPRGSCSKQILKERDKTSWLSRCEEMVERVPKTERDNAMKLQKIKTLI